MPLMAYARCRSAEALSSPPHLQVLQMPSPKFEALNPNASELNSEEALLQVLPRDKRECVLALQRSYDLVVGMTGLGVSVTRV